MNERIKLNCKKQWEVGQGHRPHQSGAGQHLDKRSKRLRTRATQVRKAIRENE